MCFAVGKALADETALQDLPEKEMYKTHEWVHGILHAPVQHCSWQRWLAHDADYWEGIMANRTVDVTHRGCNPIERAWKSLNAVVSLKHTVTLPLVMVCFNALSTVLETGWLGTGNEGWNFLSRRGCEGRRVTRFVLLQRRTGM